MAGSPVPQPTYPQALVLPSKAFTYQGTHFMCISSSISCFYKVVKDSLPLHKAEKTAFPEATSPHRHDVLG